MATDQVDRSQAEAFDSFRAATPPSAAAAQLEPGIRITIIPGALAGEMAELATAAGWDVKPSRAAAADLEAALKAGAAGRLVLFVSPGSRVPTCLTRVLIPHDATPATSAALATVGGPLWSHAEIVVLHVAAAELPSQPGSLPAPRMIDHDCYDWSDWREEFGRRFCRVSPGMLVRVELATGAREESILIVARQLRADLLILAWSGVLEANRARTVRAVCAVAPCPVLLVAGRGRGSIGRIARRGRCG
jgi:Universal stress protein family